MTSRISLDQQNSLAGPAVLPLGQRGVDDHASSLSTPIVEPFDETVERFWRQITYLMSRTRDHLGTWVASPEVKTWNVLDTQVLSAHALWVIKFRHRCLCCRHALDVPAVESPSNVSSRKITPMADRAATPKWPAIERLNSCLQAHARIFSQIRNYSCMYSTKSKIEHYSLLSKNGQ
jgi:hypothetical protein